MSKLAEGRLSAQIVAALNREPGVLARKRHISPFATAGDPDIYGIIRRARAGVHFEIEVKIPPYKPTPLQMRRLREWEEAGALVGIVHSVDDALALVRAA
jgi:hypothetical protein